MTSRAITGTRRDTTFAPPGAGVILSLLALLSLTLASLTTVRQVMGATGDGVAGAEPPQGVLAPPATVLPVGGTRPVAPEPAASLAASVPLGAALARAEGVSAFTESWLRVAMATLEAVAADAQAPAQVAAQPAPSGNAAAPAPAAQPASGGQQANAVAGGQSQASVAQEESAPEASQTESSAADSGGFLAGIEGEMVAGINAQRTGNGLAPLAVSGAVHAVARARTNDMISNGYFGHAGGVVFDMLRAAGIAFTWAGENLSRNNYPDSRSASVTVSDFMASGSHRANVLNPNYTAIGVGCKDDGSGMKYCTVVFIG